MTQPLASLVRIGAVLVACFALWATPSAAQDTSAEVRTWAGQSWRLAQPSLEVFYTIPAPPKGGAPDSYGAPPPSGGGSQSLSMSGPIGFGHASLTFGPLQPPMNTSFSVA